MLAPTKHRFTVTDYYRMAETGVLKPDARVELLNGEIIDMSPVGPFHGSITKYFDRLSGYTDSSKCLLTVFGRVESVGERDFCVLLPLEKKFLENCLDKAEFNSDIQHSDRPMTVEAPGGTHFSTRIYNFPRLCRGASRGARRRSGV